MGASISSLWEQRDVQQYDIDYKTDSPRFSVSNDDEIQRGVKYLEDHGYAVFSDVLSKEDVNKSIDLFWEHLENSSYTNTVRRNDPETWDNKWPGDTFTGIMHGEYIGQSDFMWFVRGNPNVKKAFSSIWSSNDLLVSFDVAGCFRNWHLNPEWKSMAKWFHCDQNPIKKPDRCSIQGLVSLTDTDEFTGGLVVIPESHKYFLQLQKYLINRGKMRDFISIPSEFLAEKNYLRPRLVRCKAGDLVVWDSRCIHCNTAGLDRAENYSDKDNSAGLLRLVGYVCMSPITMFKPVPTEFETLEEFIALREKYVRNRISCTHWPLELIESGGGGEREKPPLKLNRFQHSLIVGTNVEPTDENAEIIF